VIEGLWAILFGFGVFLNAVIYTKEVDNIFTTVTFAIAGYFLMTHGFETLN